MDFCEFLGSLIYRGNPGQLGLCYTEKLSQKTKHKEYLLPFKMLLKRGWHLT